MSIKYYRKYCNLSQAQLALRVGVSKNTVSLWELGHKIRSDHLVSLCNVFQCMPEDLLSGLWFQEDSDSDQIDINEFMCHEEELYNRSLFDEEYIDKNKV